MKFGLHYQLPCTGTQSPVQRYRDTIEQAVHAESLGFESIWPVEQHFNSQLSIVPAPLLLLAAVAERTQTLRLGIAIVLLPLSHPVRVAEEIATLDVMSNGRVEFGIGRGSIPVHFTGFGIDQRESRGRMMEALAMIRQAWTSERMSFRGQFYSVEDVAVVPKPVQQPHPPIRAAANSLDTFELMGRLGYPIFIAAQVNPYVKMRELIPVYHQARAAAGHAKATSDDISLLGPLYVGNSQSQIREELEPSIQRFLQSVSSIYTSQGENLGPESIRIKEALERVRRMNYDKVSEVMGLFETPQACVDRLKGLQEEFGMGRMICWFNPGGTVPHSQVMRSMELFAAKVIPQFSDDP